MLPPLSPTDVQIMASLLAVSLYVWAIIVHELGHWAAFRQLDMTVPIHWSGGSIYTGREKDYKAISKAQRIKVYLTGVGLGYVPIILFSVFWWPFIIVAVPYTLGCVPDLKKIRRCRT